MSFCASYGCFDGHVWCSHSNSHSLVAFACVGHCSILVLVGLELIFMVYVVVVVLIRLFPVIAADVSESHAVDVVTLVVMFSPFDEVWQLSPSCPLLLCVSVYFMNRLIAANLCMIVSEQHPKATAK